ncbi:MAG: PDZ domain-containing protein [Flavobacteriaceae bacterium]|nr:PDZ domain-containing protein [Flavobacteriaceae bacterium]
MKNIIQSILLFFLAVNGFSQGKFELQDNKESDKIRFKLINNLLVIPVEINGAELTFLLDSGVRKPIIFNFLNATDSLEINEPEIIYLRGLGEGEPIEAIRSRNNIVKIGNAININQNLFAVFNEQLNFAPRLGIPIHGIIGYDLFKDFIVEINYSSKYIRLNNPETYEYKECKKCETLGLEFYHSKPYINVDIRIDKKRVPVKLLVDSGGSDALWLFESLEDGIVLDKKHFDDFLGHGLSGSVYGKRSKVDEVYINNFVLKNVNVAFPDSTSIAYAKKFEERNGSFSAALLKRFNMIVDYTNAKITLKKNRYFSDPFSYNKSGIELEQSGIRVIKEKQNKIKSDGGLSTTNNRGTRIVFDTQFKLSVKPAFRIVELRKGSPAERIGLKVGDELLKVNNKVTYNYNLQEIIHFFYGETNSKIRLKIERNGVPMTFVFKLESPIK